MSTKNLMMAAGATLAVAAIMACSSVRLQHPSEVVSPTTPAAPQRIAVLELRSELVATDARIVPMAYFSDSIRGYIHDRVPALSMMTKENIQLLLPEKSGDLADCETDCEVETGRRLGADLIVTGEALRIGNQIKIVIRMHDTRTAALIKRTEITGTGPEDLQAGIPAAADALVVAAGLVPADTRFVSGPILAPAPVTKESSRSLGVVVRFASEPSGAIVRLDGELLCTSTPCQKSIIPGDHVISMEKEGFRAASQRARLVDNGAAISLALQPRFATLHVETVPNGLRVLMNGIPTNSADLQLDPGQYRFVVDDHCYQPDGQVAVLGEGDRKQLQLEPRARLATVRVLARDDSGNDLADADVSLGGRTMGKAPLELTVPLCTHSVSASAAHGLMSTASLDLKEGENREVILVLRAPTPDASVLNWRTHETNADGCRATVSTIHNVLGWTALAAGIAGGAALGAAFGEKNNVDSLAPGDPAVNGDISTGHTLNIIGLVGLGVGVIGLATFFLTLPSVPACGGGLQ